MRVKRTMFAHWKEKFTALKGGKRRLCYLPRISTNSWPVVLRASPPSTSLRASLALPNFSKKRLNIHSAFGDRPSTFQESPVPDRPAVSYLLRVHIHAANDNPHPYLTLPLPPEFIPGQARYLLQDLGQGKGSAITRKPLSRYHG